MCAGNVEASGQVATTFEAANQRSDGGTVLPPTTVPAPTTITNDSSTFVPEIRRLWWWWPTKFVSRPPLPEYFSSSLFQNDFDAWWILDVCIYSIVVSAFDDWITHRTAVSEAAVEDT